MIVLKIQLVRLEWVQSAKVAASAWGTTPNTSAHIRARAHECLAIAGQLPGGLWRTELMAIAADLRWEADEIEAGEGSGDTRPEPGRE